MSASNNKAIIRRWNEEVWKGNQNIFDEALAPNCIFHAIGGRWELKGTIDRIRVTFPDIALTIEDQFAVGNKVVTRWILSGTHQGMLWDSAPSGKKVAYRGITIDRLVDGRIVEEWCEADLLGLMQQIGAFDIWYEATTHPPYSPQIAPEPAAAIGSA